MKSLMLVVVLMMVGCGSEAVTYYVPPTVFCEGVADAYCSDEYDCMTEPGVCSDWAGFYNRCVARYACYTEILVDDHCFWVIEGSPDECDAPVGIPDECPAPCAP